jgi:hypothetical protein
MSVNFRLKDKQQIIFPGNELVCLNSKLFGVIGVAG